MTTHSDNQTTTMTALDTQIRCIARELALRKRVYPRLVAQGKMDQYLAARELRVMADVLATLQDLMHGPAQDPPVVCAWPDPEVSGA